ncbi:MAG: single-stranded-DNA-specific exonuclease RecJ [Aggregatilineales bacterium]
MVEKRWIEPEAVTIPEDFAKAIGGHPLVAETLVRRGITTLEDAREFLDPANYTPASPFDLPDMQKAVERIERAINENETIAIWGDFDVDGQTSTSLLVSALKGLGAKVTYYIPHRQTEGHGIAIGSLGRLIDEGASLIVTCDTGIAAHEAIDYANSRGVDVIITDHHQLPPELPDAFVAVNPQRLPASHPLHTLPGVGCAYELIQALYSRAGRADETENFLDLVALGIVADVATQTGDTRYLLQKGLNVLRKTERPGLKIMMEVAEINPAHLNEETIGFAIGPRMNALGRLDDANKAIELLTTHDEARARILVNTLEGLNNERRMQTKQIYQAALKQIEDDPNLLTYNALVLGHEKWDGGIVGIVASRLVERYNRPVILFTTPDESPARGSARSVNGLDITAAISEHKEMLLTFGGHTQAAGLSLPTARLPEFRRNLSMTVRRMMGKVDLTPTVTIDGFLPLNELSLPLVDDLARLAPFGAGNPPLKLATKRVKIRNQRTLGRGGEHLRLTIEDARDNVQDVIWWNAEEDQIPPGWFDLAYTLSANDFKGERQLQVVWVDAHPRDEPIEDFSKRRDVEVIDYREVGDPLDKLATIKTQYDDLMIWSEGTPDHDAQGVARDKLTSSPVLVIWTTPPHLDDLQNALTRVNPTTVILFGLSPRMDSVNGFLQRFGGAIKHVVNTQNGETTINALCGVMAHHAATVRAGLRWMQIRGHITVTENDGVLTIQNGGQKDDSQKSSTTTTLTQRLSETAHFRAYFNRADKDSLVRV